MGSCGHTWSAKEKRGFLFLWFLLLDAYFFLQPPGGSISSVWLLPCCWHSELHFWLRLSGVGWHSLRGDRLIKMMTSTVAIVVTGVSGVVQQWPKISSQGGRTFLLELLTKVLAGCYCSSFWLNWIYLVKSTWTDTYIDSFFNSTSSFLMHGICEIRIICTVLILNVITAYWRRNFSL